ncbi:MAG: hypothetical protein GY705_28945 [Bacteroidetes bacterium]|nr:hypothetical protein [Bacteroidota bacterium]
MDLYPEIDIPKRRAREPKAFNCDKTEWVDYLRHFLTVAKWNNWSDNEMANQLIMSFDGNAMSILSELPEQNMDNFHKLAFSLNQRFNPKERAEALKIEFKNRKRQNSESLLSFAQELKKLASKAYYKMPAVAQEEFILDQFLGGLENDSLEEYIRLKHPLDIDNAISLGIEYEAFKASKGDKFKKPMGEIHAIQSKVLFTRDEFQKLKNELRQEIKNEFANSKPDNSQNNNMSPNRKYNNSNDDTCHFCRKPGHYKVDCWKLKAKIERENQIQQNFGNSQGNQFRNSQRNFNQNANSYQNHQQNVGNGQNYSYQNSPGRNFNNRVGNTYAAQTFAQNNPFATNNSGN